MKLKDLDCAFPDCLALKYLGYWYGFNPSRVAAVEVTNSLLKGDLRGLRHRRPRLLFCYCVEVYGFPKQCQRRTFAMVSF